MNEFQSRLLYSQKSEIQHEEGDIHVSISVFGIRFLYPGASQHTTSRIRITCTFKQNPNFEAHAGAIERWTDKGWIYIDDYAGGVFAFDSELTFRKRLLDYTHAFIMGIPLAVIDKGYSPDIFASHGKTIKKSTNLLFGNKSKKEIVNNEKIKPEKYNYIKDSSKNDDDDDDDLDWL